ncbi:hypothetical protein PVL29_016137 [Vitis rotundifolia]|uniref:Disease resistance N-terminal domain-containing protein n=1 Tax=Vitis rotundifolia TaxID=103349 RepID=A0AA39DML5_VITRO|nr:hypothetical protein PVL29_016137 [Vitis rotundifolia]
MADALLGGAFLSASLQILLDRLASPEAVKCSMIDAEVKQFSNQAVKEWLKQVKDAAYEVEDLMRTSIDML